MPDHHLVLGTLRDALTGEVLEDTYDERHRQELAQLLVGEKGYPAADITPRLPIHLDGTRGPATVLVDFAVRLEGRIALIVRYGPGSIVTRERPALAASRLVAAYQVPLVVVTNNVDAVVLWGATGKKAAKGMAGIPAREELAALVAGLDAPYPAVDGERAARERKILYTFEAVGACNCDEC